MNDPINLGEIERRGYLSYHEDGLIDIFVAIFLIWAAFSMIFVESLLIAALSATLFVFYIGAKKSITIPRMGQVRFSPARKGKIKRTTVALTILGTISLIANLVFFLAWEIGMRELVVSFIDHSTIILGSIGASLAFLVAYLSEINRFKVYGLATVIIFPLAYFMEITFYLPLMIIGISIFFSGLFHLARFLRSNPRPSGDELDAQAK